MEDVVELLADERCRFVLKRLSAVDRLDFDELSAAVAAHNGVPDDQLDDVRITLHHYVLPKLDQARLIDYDASQGRIHTDVEYAAIEEYLGMETDVDE